MVYQRTKWTLRVGLRASVWLIAGLAIVHNVSSVYDVKNGHTPKFAMKNGFFVFKAEGREII